jgi:hypothetical protein
LMILLLMADINDCDIADFDVDDDIDDQAG